MQTAPSWRVLTCTWQARTLLMSTTESSTRNYRVASRTVVAIEPSKVLGMSDAATPPEMCCIARYGSWRMQIGRWAAPTSRLGYGRGWPSCGIPCSRHPGRLSSWQGSPRTVAADMTVAPANSRMRPASERWRTRVAAPDVSAYEGGGPRRGCTPNECRGPPG